MTELSKKIFSNYQVRKTRKQKTEFIELLEKELQDKQITVESGGWTRCRNIIVGDIEKAEYILGAHYDTQPVLPFPKFLTPKNMFIYILYVLLIVIFLFAVEFVVIFVARLVFQDSEIVSALSRLVLGVLLIGMLFGPANKHTANDNTSGVITLIEAIHNEEIAKKAAFVFFDQEELGLFGSAFFAKKHKKLMKDKLLINFDCVSDGNHMMFIYSKPAKKYQTALESACTSTKEKNAVHTDAAKTLYPSDQMNFKCSVGVAAFNKNKLFGYYIDKIHTPKDIVFDERNIEFLIDGLVRFFQNIESKEL